jgi:hypothetical protein
MNRKAKLILAAAVFGAAVLSAPTAAQASTTDEVRNCLEYFPTSGRVYVEYRFDSCGGRQVQSKVVVDWGPDSSCHTLSLGDGYVYTWPIGSLNRIAPC